MAEVVQPVLTQNLSTGHFKAVFAPENDNKRPADAGIL
jgi:hypothetical protein